MTADNDDLAASSTNAFGVSEQKGLSRRTLMKGAAWAVPAIALVSSAPAYAVSCGTMTATATGKFLSGYLLGTNLDNVVDLAGVSASEPGGTTDPETKWQQLKVTVLDGLTVNLTGFTGSLSQILSFATNNTGVGTLAQYAYANSNGDSKGASGAVDDSGNLALNTNGSYPTLGTLDLGTILKVLTGNSLSNVTSLMLNIGGLLGRSSIGSPCATEQTRNYLIAYLRLTLGVPLVANIVNDVIDATKLPLATLYTLDGLQINGDILTHGVSGPAPTTGLPTPANPALPLPNKSTDPIQADLSNGTVVVDLGTLLGGGASSPFGQVPAGFLNGKPANTMLFGPATPLPNSAVTTFVTDLIAGLEDRLLDAASLNSGGTQYTLRQLEGKGLLGSLVKLVIDTVNTILTVTLTAAGGVLTLISSALTAVFTALSGAIEVTLNVQNTTSTGTTPSGWPTTQGGNYQVAALGVQAAKAVSAQLLSLYLARGEAGPNV